MQRNRSRGLYESGRITFLPVDRLFSPAPERRRTSDGGSMRELTASIARYGVLQPLSVCRQSGRYRIISGCRRWRAAVSAGLKEVPCVVMDVGQPETEVLGLIENLQHRQYDFVEEAESLRRLIYLHGYTRQEVARRLGMSQSAIANKLRVLKLPRNVLHTLISAGLTERHARALLRLEDEAEIKSALEQIVAQGLNVTQTDELIDGMTGENRRLYVIRDLRLFMNTVTRGVEMLRTAGVDAEMSRSEAEGRIVLTVDIKKEQ